MYTMYTIVKFKSIAEIIIFHTRIDNTLNSQWVFKADMGIEVLCSQDSNVLSYQGLV